MTPKLATLAGVWCYRASARTGWLSISMMCLGLISNFCLCVAAHATDSVYPFPKYTSISPGHEATNKQKQGNKDSVVAQETVEANNQASNDNTTIQAHEGNEYSVVAQETAEANKQASNDIMH